MAYVRKILAPEEKLIGIARLHWIYVLKGLAWFLILSLAGWAMDQVITRTLYLIAETTSADRLSGMALNMSNNIMLFMMGGGLLIFILMVMKVFVTEVGLSNRRVLLKEGWLFVKVKQIDLEEIRGENMDLGWFGRILGYAYILLDCRFIGDVRLPAIEYPERFMRALHQTRSIPADTLSVVLGKGNAMPVGRVDENITNGPDTPKPAPPVPTPEIQPGQVPGPEVNPPNTPQPEIQPPPVPHSPPPQSPPPQPEQPPAQPQQPTPAPFNPEPPLQPPSGDVRINEGPPVPHAPDQPNQPEQQPAQVLQTAVVSAPNQPPAPPQQPQVPPQLQANVSPTNDQIVPPVVAQSVALSPDAVAQVVQQVMPQMAEQVVKKMAEQGLIHPEEPANDVGQNLDTDLIDSFDEARLKKGGRHDLRDKMEHAIH